MPVRQALRHSRWLLPVFVFGLITTASSLQPDNGAEPDGYERADEGALEDGPRTYTVQTGDTLWDISNRFLGSPWYWPQVWSFNPQIANPHWIYPGNTIRFMASSDLGPVQLLDAGDGIVLADSGMADELVGSSGELVYRVPTNVTVIEQGFTTREEVESAGRIVASFEEKMLLTRFDRVYVEMPEPRLGQRYVVFRTGREVFHPRTGESLGFHTLLMGDLRIVEARADGLATAIVGETLDPIERGDRLLPWTEPFVREIARRENTTEVEGVVIDSLVPRTRIFAQNQYVFIDRGSRDGVQVGNNFDVMRRGDPLARFIRDLGEVELPWEAVGSILITDTREDTSVGLVVRSLRELEPGEKVLMQVNGVARHASR